MKVIGRIFSIRGAHFSTIGVSFNITLTLLSRSIGDTFQHPSRTFHGRTHYYQVLFLVITIHFWSRLFDFREPFLFFQPHLFITFVVSTFSKDQDQRFCQAHFHSRSHFFKFLSTSQTPLHPTLTTL